MTVGTVGSPTGFSCCQVITAYFAAAPSASSTVLRPSPLAPTLPPSGVTTPWSAGILMILASMASVPMFDLLTVHVPVITLIAPFSDTMPFSRAYSATLPPTVTSPPATRPLAEPFSLIIAPFFT